jgi:hypothetical protein
MKRSAQPLPSVRGQFADEGGVRRRKRGSRALTNKGYQAGPIELLFIPYVLLSRVASG